MKAVVLRERGGPEVLRVEERPVPRPARGEVVIALRAAALNHRDVWLRLGVGPRAIADPFVPGSDGAGEVVEVGEGVDASWNGRHVIINPSLDWGDDVHAQGPKFRILGMPDDGTYAECITVPAANVHPKPDHLSFEEAAAIPLAALTAYRALTTRARLQPGETVIVTGIGGGVAQYALAIAKALGALVIVTSSSEEKLDRARYLGADVGVSYRDSTWPSLVRELTNGQGADVVIDGAGGESLAKALDAVRPGGRIVNYGGTAGPMPQIHPRTIFWNQVSVLGTTMGSPQEFRGMVELFQARTLRPVIDSTFPLADVAAAHARMERGEQFGKIVLAVA